jgi:Zn-dependent peptidase ImmA (M78 family)
LKASVRREAERLIAQHNLHVPIDLDLLAAKLGLQIHVRPFENHLSGLLITESDSHVIGVNATHARVRQRFTIAHEIGHLRLHSQQKSLFVDEVSVFFRNTHSKDDIKLEREANDFAAALRRLAREFDVSPHAMMIRLQTLGIG